MAKILEFKKPKKIKLEKLTEDEMKRLSVASDAAADFIKTVAPIALMIYRATQVSKNE